MREKCKNMYSLRPSGFSQEVFLLFCCLFVKDFAYSNSPIHQKQYNYDTIQLYIFSDSLNFIFAVRFMQQRKHGGCRGTGRGKSVL